jgi:hypothetical protein
LQDYFFFLLTFVFNPKLCRHFLLVFSPALFYLICHFIATNGPGLPKLAQRSTFRILSEMPQKPAIGTIGPSFQKEFS